MSVTRQKKPDFFSQITTTKNIFLFGSSYIAFKAGKFRRFEIKKRFSAAILFNIFQNK